MFVKHIKRRDMIDCALCYKAPCTGSCTKTDPAKILRSIWFDNEQGACHILPEESPCIGCDAPCERACVRPGKVKIKELITRLNDEVKPSIESAEAVDESILATTFCGIPIDSPFLLSSSVIASTYDMCDRAFEAGWAGAAFKTICTLDIHEASPRFSAVTGSDGSLIGFKNIEQLSDHSVEENMEIFRRLKAKHPTKLILASIMGQDDGEWEELSRLCEQNGADAIELNFSCPNMMEGGLGSDIGQVPELVERFTRAARRGTNIPILAKLTPNVATMSPAAEAAIRGGANGIAAINTIKSLTDINPHTYISSPAVHGMSAVGGYSGNAVKPIALRFIDELGHNPNLKGKHISAMGGIETWSDALEYILLGAGSVQVTTAVMQYGYRIIDDLKQGLALYMKDKALTDIKQIRGAALDSVSSTTDVLERDTIIYPKFKRDNCIGCGRCVISCADGGHQALSMNEDRHVRLNPQKCVGCHLCVLVCQNGAITSGRKRVTKKV
ncbi:MAG: NAD-dependent dihydropyrimidine dehydrogenase subunit PreA [Saccharofermentans sp.]|nr:NAD-dependent dihydropyrimidine dehydrogenase subunit PreA [Saccharofermentans sp.]